MSFGQILAKRIGYGLVLLVAVVVLNFTLITIAPGTQGAATNVLLDGELVVRLDTALTDTTGIRTA